MNVSRRDRKVRADLLDHARQLVLDDERRAPRHCSTMKRTSWPTRRKLIGTATSPALAVAA